MNPILRNLLLFCIFIVPFKTSLAQAPTLAKVVPPSPNMQAFQKYGNIPISNYTGLPNISIPVYTIKFRDISYPISLSYHASGIKVAEEASQVGLGWALNALSSISRNVIGDDDFNGSVYFHSTFNNLPDFSGGQGPRDVISHGTILNLFNKNQSPTMFTKDLTAEFNNAPPYDFQPDQYNYSLNGRSGKFVLNRDYQAIIERQEKLQITTVTGGASWKIVSDDGFIYDFTAYETYHDEGGDHKSAWYLTKITSPAGNSITFNYTTVNRTVKTIGGWSETWDYYDPAVISGFSDQPYFQTHNTGHQSGAAPGKEYTLLVLDNIDFNAGVVKFNYSDRDDLVDDKKLDNISVYTKNAAGVVSTTPLKTITMTYGYFDHGDTDDDAGTGNANTAKRLKLVNVQQTGYYGGTAVSENPYTFTYNESNYLPSKGSFARDHWGYYNGITNTSTLIPSVIPLSSPDPITAYMGLPGPEREPNATLVGTYALSSIQYPTGGTTEFQFEANDFDEQQSRVNDFSYFNKTFTVQSKSVTLNYDNQVGQKVTPSDTLDISDEYMYVPNPLQPSANSTVSVRIVIRFSDLSACTNMPNPFPTTDKLTFDFYDVTGTTLMFHKDASYFPTCSGGGTDNCMTCSGPAFTYNMNNLTLPPAKYKLKVHVDPSFSAIQDIHFTFTYYTQTGSQNSGAVAGNSTYTTGGGLRIKRIIDHDAANPANINVKKFNYHYFANKDGSGTKEYTYGRRMSHPVYTNFTFSYDTQVRHYGSLTIPTPTLGTHMMRSADSNIPLNGSAGGAVVGYDQVEVLEGENGENGKTVYSYVNQPDHVSDYSQYSLPVQAPFASNVPELGNGNLLSEVTYKNVSGQFVKVKELTNTYYETPAIQNDVYGLECRVPTGYHFEDGALSTGLPISPDNRDIVTYFSLRSKFSYLGQTNQKIYDPLDNTNTKYAETNTVYNYDNPQHLQLTSAVTSNSKGETVTTYNKYPLDYTLTGTVTDSTALGISKLVAKNLVKPLIEKYVKITNADGSNARVTNALFTKYKTTMPMPDVMQMDNSITPITGFTPASITASATITDSRYKPYVVFDNYDSWGNLVQQHKYLGANDAYIWGYNKQYPIAQASNARYNEIMFSSFDEPVGWDANLTAYDAAFKRTGLSSGRIDNTNTTEVTSLNSNWLTISQTAARKYHYSGWVYSNGPTADLYLLMKRAGETGYTTYADFATTTVTGSWTYIEKDYLVPADVTQMTLRVDNNGALNGGTKVWFDDVRLYPSDAQMSTYTYEPLVGMTSATDARNMTTYYEYDGLARLLNIRDQNGKILKNYSYNYVSLAPVWTDNGTTMCVQSGGANTGEQQKQQADTNPLSVTYNQTRWVSNGTNTTACPLPATVYVKQTVGSTSVSNGLTYNTLKFNTYSDANCTVLVNAPVTLTVNYSYVTSRSYADGRTPNPEVTTTNATITITAGTNQATSGSIIISGCFGTADKQICYTPSTQITVQPGTGYIPVNPEN
ncbi:hypothetical protein [Mucilaginibacter ginsenosidivorax]|uniref:RHS repeat protein n=1 Tax=Mucilaginibacter ginsenosidivorax TaxID=862126 RepID=A0A5B8W995_9SPHI|nr:hypothetical protein [Mucilaginibacter ginsenosidivorax]QEC79535.1 hypothetical protein FSB76_27630 [Mucilaginibacter ginsenosidivorax]